jgi:hypothetical protein
LTELDRATSVLSEAFSFLAVKTHIKPTIEVLSPLRNEPNNP